MPKPSHKVGDSKVVSFVITESWSFTSAFKNYHRRARARSVCLAADIGSSTVPGRKPEHLWMSALSPRESSCSFNSCGVFTITVFKEIIALVRFLQAISRATLIFRIISTVPSALLGTAVEVPAMTLRAASSASSVSLLPLARRAQRSPRFTSTTFRPWRRR